VSSRRTHAASLFGPTLFSLTKSLRSLTTCEAGGTVSIARTRRHAHGACPPHRQPLSVRQFWRAIDTGRAASHVVSPRRMFCAEKGLPISHCSAGTDSGIVDVCDRSARWTNQHRTTLARNRFLRRGVCLTGSPRHNRKLSMRVALGGVGHGNRRNVGMDAGSGPEPSPTRNCLSPAVTPSGL
jgi:hypothetical protein